MMRRALVFFRGAGSILNVAPRAAAARIGAGILDRSDEQKIAQDWENVARDIRFAITKAHEEFGAPSEVRLYLTRQ